MAEQTRDSGKRSRYTPSQMVRLHRRQLFHWIGSDLLKEGRSLNDSIRKQYVSYLRGSLERGLWLKCPRESDMLLDGKQFKVTEPICCFTETSLDQIEDHSRSYGRLGLGFPKRFVLDRGGRPVNYLNGQKTDPSMSAWLCLAETLRNPGVLDSLPPKKKIDVEEALTFVSHFLKPMKQPPRTKAKRATTQKQTKPDKEQVEKTVENPFRRSFGGPLHFLEEREWRFVLRETRNGIIPKNAQKNPQGNETSQPLWFLPYTPGEDLFTIVFPDNATLAMAIDDDDIRQKLFNKHRPHVTLLTLEDIGTY